MKIIVIDRDRDSCDQILAAFEAAGVEGVSAPTRNAAVQMFKEGGYDAIFMDPTPQANEVRAFIISLRRSTGSFPPVVIMGNPAVIGMTFEDVIHVGGNDFLPKPFTDEQLIEKVRTVSRVVDAANMLSDGSRDGIISKSSFNQLFITCLDRADRYGEQSYLITVNIDNLAEIAELDGEDAAAKTADNLHAAIGRIRRLSDIAGHVGQATFCLLLMRPSAEDEPFLALNRFAESLKLVRNDLVASNVKPVIKLTLLAVPTGEIPLEHVIGNDD